MSVVECASTKTASGFSETDEIRISGTIAQGRSNQISEKDELLLRFASRVCDGITRPDEVAYMLALMAQDMPKPTFQ